jgi:hypothetical protein
VERDAEKGKDRTLHHNSNFFEDLEGLKERCGSDHFRTALDICPSGFDRAVRSVLFLEQPTQRGLGILPLFVGLEFFSDKLKVS